MVEDFSQTHKAKSHAKSQETSGAGNICNSAHLFSFPEPLAVRLLDKDVDDGQVALGIFVNLFFYCESQRFVVQPLPTPAIVLAVIQKVREELKSLAEIRKVGSQWNSLFFLAGI